MPIPASLSLGHLKHILTDVGLWQHTDGPHPNRAFGYSIDDEARGLLVALGYWKQHYEPAFQEKLGGICFRFLKNAAITDGPDAGKFHNFCDEQGCWLDPLGSDDSFGRTFWALGAAHADDAPFAPRTECEPLLRRALLVTEDVTADYLRSKAFVILGLAACRLDDGLLRLLAGRLASAYTAQAEPEWRWFEPQMTYCNARLPQALLLASACFPKETRWRKLGMESLDFLLDRTRNAYGSYDPVGNDRLTEAGWFQKGETSPPRFDQQPVDAGALVEACATAFQVTGEERFPNGGSRCVPVVPWRKRTWTVALRCFHRSRGRRPARRWRQRQHGRRIRRVRSHGSSSFARHSIIKERFLYGRSQSPSNQVRYRRLARHHRGRLHRRSCAPCGTGRRQLFQTRLRARRLYRLSSATTTARSRNTSVWKRPKWSRRPA